MVWFDMTVERDGKQLDGHNVQVVLRAGIEPRYRDAAPALVLASGWRVTYRNQFEQAPDVATEIIRSEQQPLEEIAREASQARGDATNQLWETMKSKDLSATGPDYWR